MNNINDTYFDGYYKDIWRSIIPAELTPKEVDFMIQYFNLEPGNKVLDIMCGYGRHAIELAKKGISVTAIDNLGDYIDEIKRIASEEDLPVKAIKANVINYAIDEEYDLAICMGNSLNFFDKENVRRLFKSIHVHLKPAGHVLINTWSLAEIAIKNFAARTWSEINGVKHIAESRYLFQPSRIEFDSTFLFPDGRVEQKKAVDYIFSVAEIESLLNDTGFKLKEIYSIPGKKKFTLGEPRAYIVAEKV
ncbi:MAG TPA: methyltransferase domain-containing protein [Chitinophagaceae bacterium]|nr:methyltransferase domain-containing protein [Chitinophagaceae bacterium]